MQLNEGYEHAQSSGTDARENIEQAVPRYFRIGLWLSVGTTFVVWLLLQIRRLVNQFILDKPKAESGETPSSVEAQDESSNQTNIEIQDLSSSDKRSAAESTGWYQAGIDLWSDTEKSWLYPLLGSLLVLGVVLICLSWIWKRYTWIRPLGWTILLFWVLLVGGAQLLLVGGKTVSGTLSCAVDPDQSLCKSLAKKRAEATDLVRAEELATAAHAAAVLAAAEAAAEQARLAALPKIVAVTGVPCSTERGKFKELTAVNECEVVTFGRNEKYHFTGDEDFCPRAVPGNAGEWVSLGGTQYDFIPYQEGVTVTFYLQEKGRTFLKNDCS